MPFAMTKSFSIWSSLDQISLVFLSLWYTDTFYYFLLFHDPHFLNTSLSFDIFVWISLKHQEKWLHILMITIMFINL